MSLEGHFLVDDVIIDILHSICIKGSQPTQQLVGDDPQTPDVYLFIVLLVTNQLWRHVKRSTQDKVEALLLVKLLGKSQVGYFDVKFVFLVADQKNILWLHVPMCDILLMHIVEAPHDLINNVCSLLLCEALDSRESLEQLSSSNVLRDHVVVLGILEKLDDSDNVWVALFAQDA